MTITTVDDYNALFKEEYSKSIWHLIDVVIERIMGGASTTLMEAILVIALHLKNNSGEDYGCFISALFSGSESAIDNFNESFILDFERGGPTPDLLNSFLECFLHDYKEDTLQLSKEQMFARYLIRFEALQTKPLLSAKEDILERANLFVEEFKKSYAYLTDENLSSSEPAFLLDDLLEDPVFMRPYNFVYVTMNVGLFVKQYSELEFYQFVWMIATIDYASLFKGCHKNNPFSMY